MSDSIEVLQGPDRVRKRPVVIFGSQEQEGVFTAVKMLLSYFEKACLDEICTKLTVTQYIDQSISIQDNGPGIFIGDNDLRWEALFCNFFGDGATEMEPCNLFTNMLGDNFELYAVQCASEYMDVVSNRDGFVRELRFEKGWNVGGLHSLPCDQPSGSYIRFRLDHAVFPDIEIPGSWLADLLQGYALRAPGLQAVFRQETPGGFRSNAFFYPNGIADYLAEKCQDCTATTVFIQELEATGRERYNKPDYTAKIKVGICFTKEPGEMLCIHNGKKLTVGGAHKKALLEQVSQKMHLHYRGRVAPHTALAHMWMVLITDASVTVWSDEGAHCAIENTLLRDMAEDLINYRFRTFLRRNRQQLKEIFPRDSTE